jgi:hypothetical protein
VTCGAQDDIGGANNTGGSSAPCSSGLLAAAVRVLARDSAAQGFLSCSVRNAAWRAWRDAHGDRKDRARAAGGGSHHHHHAPSCDAFDEDDDDDGEGEGEGIGDAELMGLELAAADPAELVAAAAGSGAEAADARSIEAHIVHNAAYGCPVLMLTEDPLVRWNRGGRAGQDGGPVDAIGPGDYYYDGHGPGDYDGHGLGDCDGTAGPSGCGARSCSLGRPPLGFATHPVLGTPMRVVHPCQTADLMATVAALCPAAAQDSAAYLRTWLGLAADHVGLDLAIA